MKRLAPFLIAGVIAEGALLLLERLQPQTGRGDGFGPHFFFEILAGILHAPAYGVVLLLQIPEPYHRWVIPPIQVLCFAVVFWLSFRFLLAPYRTKAPPERTPPNE